MKNIFRFLTAMLVTVFASACNHNNQGVSAPDEAEHSLLRRVIEHDGIEREFFVHLPRGIDNIDEPVPVVVAMHGYTSTATGFSMAFDLNSHADKNGYIIVYPQGSHFFADGPAADSYRVTSWNDLAANLEAKPEGPHCTADASPYPCPPECGSCTRCGWTSCNDDVGFMEKLLDAVQAEFAADPQRYYLLGVSNGGMMTLRLGCNLSDRFAAIAPIIGQLAPGYACGPDVDLPMLHLYGGKDNTVRFDGLPAGDGYIYTTAEKTAEVWADALACSADPTSWENEFSMAAILTCTAWSDCRVDGHEVISCLDPDAGHDWPGQRVESMPATCVTREQFASMPGQEKCPEPSDESPHMGMDLVWDFFSRYRAAATPPGERIED